MWCVPSYLLTLNGQNVNTQALEVLVKYLLVYQLFLVKCTLTFYWSYNLKSLYKAISVLIFLFKLPCTCRTVVVTPCIWQRLIKFNYTYFAYSLGTANRTVAATQMNATSSRAHTVVTIVFDQISKNQTGQETKKSSNVNLVDLAGLYT